MAHFTGTWMILLLGLILVCDLKNTWADKVQVQAFTGDNITLNCTGETTITDSTGVYWNRTDLQQDNYVLFYRDNRSDPDNQDFRYKDRVELADRYLKDNNISIIIENVSVNDSGTYECKLIQGGASDGNIFNKPPIKTFKLIITEKDKVKVQAFTGDNITLNCTGETTITDSTGVYWNRTDLQQDNYVLFHRNGRSDPDNQDPRYKDRVQLADRDLKDNFSIVLQNLSLNDSGTYMCEMIQGGGSGIDKKLIIMYELNVTDTEIKDKGPDKNNLWLVVGLVIAAAVVVVVVVVLVVRYIFYKRQQASQENYIGIQMANLG